MRELTVLAFARLFARARFVLIPDPLERCDWGLAPRAGAERPREGGPRRRSAASTPRPCADGSVGGHPNPIKTES